MLYVLMFYVLMLAMIPFDFRSYQRRREFCEWSRPRGRKGN